MAKETKTLDAINDPFSGIKSYSVAEVIAAGGTTAFANKLGKNPQDLVDYLKELPDDAFLTDEEAEAALKYLRENK